MCNIAKGGLKLLSQAVVYTDTQCDITDVPFLNGHLKFGHFKFSLSLT